jgi:transcription factor TFIIIB component B''
MSSFSSVVRKPGQKIAPRAAPRRNVQRRAQKDNAVAVLLTPESQTQPAAVLASASDQSVDDAQPAQDASTSILTPPPTANGDYEEVVARSPSPEPAPEIPEETITRSVQRSTDAVPTVTTSQVSTNSTRRSRRSSAATTVQEPVDNQRPQEPLSQPLETAEPPPKRRKIAATTSKQPKPVVDHPLTRPSQNGVRTEQSIPTPSNNVSRNTDDLVQQFQSVTSATRSISELLAQSTTPRSTGLDSAASIRDTPPVDATGNTSQPVPGAVENVAAQIVASAIRGKKKRKPRPDSTPEDAEAYRIDPNTTSMFDLINDSGLGKRSETGKRLDAEWSDIKSRWDAKLEANRTKARLKAAERKAARTGGAGAAPTEGEELISAAAAVPEFVMANGIIQVVESTRQIDFNDNIAERIAQVDESEIQTDERIYNYVNQNRIGKKAGLQTRTKWNDELDQKFWQGLRTFGTDFEMVARFLGGDWTRRQVKAKFVREERLDFGKVKAALSGREQLDLAGYATLTGEDTSTFIDPKALEDELAAMEAKMNADYAKAKNGGDQLEDEDGAEAEEQEQNEADHPIESIETDHPPGAVEQRRLSPEQERLRETPSAASNRNVAMAAAVVRDAIAPTKRKRQPAQPQRKQREQTGVSRTGGASAAPGSRKSTKGRKPLEGVEERIGAAGEVD